jgi:cold shock CspA family protein
MMPERNGTLADRRPHAAGDRLQADAMLIRRPDLDFGARMLAPLIGGGSMWRFTHHNGGNDVFLHISIVERAGLRTVDEGQRLAMKVVNTQKGREAISFSVID